MSQMKEKKKKRISMNHKIWKLLGLILIFINLFCLIGAIIRRNPFEALWISHYAGLLGAIILIMNFQSPILNGIYSFIFIFQLGSAFMHIIDPVPYNDYLDVLYWFNHIPHLIGFYIILKKEIDIRGIHFGFIFMLFTMNVTFQILYINSQEFLGINIVYREYFFSVLMLAIIWYLFLLYLINKHNNENKL